MTARQRRWSRWLGRAVAGVAAGLALGLVGVILLLGTAAGRRRVLDAVVARVDAMIPGRLEIDGLQRLDPFAVQLSGVRLFDPGGAQVLALSTVGVELEPFELLHARVVLDSVALGPGRVDLRKLGTPGEGLVAALVSPAAPATSPLREPRSPPYVRVQRIEVSQLDLVADLPAPWGELTLRDLAAAARFELDGAPDLLLESLSADVLRDEQPLLRVAQLNAHLAHPEHPSELGLRLELGQARLNASARAVLGPPEALDTRPLGAELELVGLLSEDLARILGAPELARAFAGPLTLGLSASGSLSRLSTQATLGTAAGELQIRSQLRERRLLELSLSARELVLARLRPELPAAALGFDAEASLDASDPARIPLSLRVHSGRLGGFQAPELAARGTWTGQRVEDLLVEATRGQSVVSVRGNADVAGAFALAVAAHVRPDELAEWARSAGVPDPPRGFLNANVRVSSSARGLFSIAGAVRARRLRFAELALDDARVEMALDGPPLALGGRAELTLAGLTFGERHVSRARLELRGGPDGYRLRGRGDVDQSSAALDLRVQRNAGRFLVQGRAAGRYGDLPVSLRIEPTTIDPKGSLETAGIALEAAGQRLRVSGGYGRPGAELVLEAPFLDLPSLAELAGAPGTWTGRGALEARLTGRLEAPALDARLEVRDFSRDGGAALRTQLVARLDAQGGRASLDAAIATESAPGWLEAAAAVTSEFEGGRGWVSRLGEARQHAAIEMKRLELSGLEPWLGRELPVSALLSLSARLDGSVRQPELHATLRGDVEQSHGLGAVGLRQRLDYRDGALATRLDIDDALGRWLRLDAELALPPDAASDLSALASGARQLPDAARWKLALTAAPRRLGALWLDAPPVAADLALDADVELSHAPGAEPAGRGTLLVITGAAQRSFAGCTDVAVAVAVELELAERKLQASLAASHSGTQLLRATTQASLALGDALRGAGPATLGALSGELTATELDLRDVPHLCQRVRGRLTARAELADVLGENPSLSADVQAQGLSLGAEPSLDLKLEAHADRDVAAASASIRAPLGQSSLTARVPISWSSGRFAVASDAPLSARAELVELPIAPLLDPAGALSYATGWVSGTVALSGTSGAPEPSGVLELRDAELTATALAQPLHGVGGRFAFDRRALRISRFEAHDRDGVLALAGEVDRRDENGLDVRLDVRAKSFPLRQRGQVVATTSGHAKIDATLSRDHSNVSVLLMDADTWLEKVQARTGIDLRAHPDFVMAAAPEQNPSPGGARRPGAVDPALHLEAPGPSGAPGVSHIRIDASDHFWIKREDFAIQLSTRLDASIEGDQTRVRGRVDIFRGYLDLMGRIFNVDRSSHLDFTGTSTPDPIVDITATYEQRSSGKTVKVQISGPGSKPVLTFFIDNVGASAGEALEVLIGRRSSGNEESARQDATSFVSGLTAGLLATSARRELGAAAPIIMIEPGDQTGEGRVRAGFELDALVPPALRQLITGVYVEGIVEREGSGNPRAQAQEASTQAGVLVELYFPHQLFSTGQWGPGTTWSLDWGWQL